MYVFFSASLPELQLGNLPELSVAAFDALAREQLPEKEAQLLAAPESPDAVAVCRKMRQFDTYLRTAIARQRAAKLHKEAELPETNETFSDVDFYLPEAAAAPVDEREKLVDRIRWRYLNELEFGHDFDLEHLAIYRMRLELLDKYRRRSDSGEADFKALLDRLSPTENDMMQTTSLE